MESEYNKTIKIVVSGRHGPTLSLSHLCLKQAMIHERGFMGEGDLSTREKGEVRFSGVPGPEVHSCRTTRLLPLDGSVGEGAGDDLPRQRRLGETVTQRVSGHQGQQGERPP